MTDDPPMVRMSLQMFEAIVKDASDGKATVEVSGGIDEEGFVRQVFVHTPKPEPAKRRRSQPSA